MTTDVELLKRAWRNEKAAPVILEFESSLVQRSREQIQLMEETVEEFEGNGTDPLTVSLYQMDVDRTQFLLRSYLRIRLRKIEKYVIYISKTDMWNRLSEQEQKFAKRCMDDMEKHLTQSVLSKLPYGYQSILKQSISSEEDDMGFVLLALVIGGSLNLILDLLHFLLTVPEPQLDTFVFCKSKGSLGAFQLDDSGEEIVDLAADDLYVLRYKSVKPLIENGQIHIV